MYLTNLYINLKVKSPICAKVLCLVKSVKPLNKKNNVSCSDIALDVNSLQRVGRCQKYFIILKKINNQTHLIIYNYWVIIFQMNIVNIIHHS